MKDMLIVQNAVKDVRSEYISINVEKVVRIVEGKYDEIEEFMPILITDFSSPLEIINKIILYCEYLTDYYSKRFLNSPYLYPELIFYPKGDKDGIVKYYLGYDELVPALEEWFYSDNPMKYLDDLNSDSASIWMLSDLDHEYSPYRDGMINIVPVTREIYADLLI